MKYICFSLIRHCCKGKLSLYISLKNALTILKSHVNKAYITLRCVTKDFNSGYSPYQDIASVVTVANHNLNLFKIIPLPADIDGCG